MNLQPSENEALDDSALLIKYAAESPKKLPDDIVRPIANAWKARIDNSWDPQISTSFWTSYSSLCDLLKPVTLDTISADKPTITVRRWWLFGEQEKISLARRTARRYLSLLLLLLIVAVIFGFIASTSSSLTEDVRNLVTKGNVVAVDVTADLSAIKADLDASNLGPDSTKVSLDDPRIKPEIRKKIDDLRARLQDLYYISDQLNEKINAISEITAFSGLDYSKGDLSRLPNLTDGFDNLRSYYGLRRDLSATQQSVYILNGAYSALVPLLLGALGACTYVLRLTSEQIRDTTFSDTSPTRHFVRISLGALAGLAVGLGGLVNAPGLSTAALSFLAGYPVEPVFATLDGIAEKFRRG